MPIFYKNKIIILLCTAVFLAGCAAQAPHLKLTPSLEKDIKTFNNIQYVSLAKLCDAYGAKCDFDPFIKTIALEKKGRIALRVDSDIMLAKGEQFKLESPVVMSGGAIFVPISFIKNGLGHIVPPAYEAPKIGYGLPEAGPKEFTIRTIVVDPGHGGRDPGAISRKFKMREKHITLAISKKLKNILEERGIKIIMTRQTDTFVSLPKRSEMANKSGADLFVSVHINASRTKSLNGFECYYLSEAADDNARAIEAFENSSLKLGDSALAEHSTKLDKALWDMTLTENRRESAELAGRICDSVGKGLLAKNRGIRTARFYVLKRTRIPAVLVEAGYISNKEEEMKFNDQAYLDRMAEALAKGILAYKGEYENTEGFTKGGGAG